MENSLYEIMKKQEEVRYVHIGNISSRDLSNPLEVREFYSGMGNIADRIVVGPEVNSQRVINPSTKDIDNGLGLYMPVDTYGVIDSKIACTYDVSGGPVTLQEALRTSEIPEFMKLTLKDLCDGYNNKRQYQRIDRLEMLAA
ncbi:MAG: hypothetical protein ABH824_01460 [Nanoarchaeota archaeon]|nr:hypothetical protein [Nanoarchaeota archaeon]MBU1631780.1 hypothetical protein [Nanoarchaeota archaeon]MBU1876289.1 hypothetical protein [Nanoarchaeota archaeon]